MTNAAARFGGGFLALTAIWIGVYWLWEPSRSAGVSFSDESIRDSAHVTTPLVPAAAKPPETNRNEVTEVIKPVVITNIQPIADRAATPPKFQNYTIRRGDTFESISRRFFGTIRRAEAIAKANPFVSPTKLREGQVIRIPADTDNVQGRPADGDKPDLPTPEFVEYIVVRGDTLSEIAQRFYGSLRYAEVIFNANRETMRSIDDLSIGDVLRIPSRESVLGKASDD